MDPRITYSQYDICLQTYRPTRLYADFKLCVFLYVNDILLIGDSINQINEYKKQLCEHFDMVEVGEIKSFLGLEIERNRKNKTLIIGSLINPKY